eukprot:477791-Hanusia_phi.AAC.1
MDGSRLESALTELGWDIEFEVNLTLDDMVEALERFRDSVKDNTEAALFSFVGHATEINGKLFLIPGGLKQKDTTSVMSDDDLERHLCRHALPFVEVQAILRQVRKGQKPTVFVLDCCRSNGFYSTRAA